MAEVLNPKKTGHLLTRYGLAVDLIGLLISIVVVHAFYLLYITPAATEMVVQAVELGTVPERTLAIVLMDIEQEACLVLAFWCIWLWFFRYRMFQSDSYLLDLVRDYLERMNSEEFENGVDKLGFVESRIQELQVKLKDSQLVNALDLAVQRIRLNLNFQEASDVAMEACDLHLELLYSKLSITRYILWAIPSIGFLGTVRGISMALGKASEAQAGDLSGIGASLGVAFNSTFVALAVSLLIMLISSSLQGREERLVAQFKHFISSTFIPVLSVRMEGGSTPLVVSDEKQESQDTA